MLISSRHQPTVEVPEDALVMRALVRAGETPDVSVTYVRLSGAHRVLRTVRSTRVYYVLEGAARFTVGDGEPFDAECGDAVIIPRGMGYSLQGTLVYLVINSPAFVDGDDIYDGAR